MIVTVDQKRRVVLPQSVKPGDALEVTAMGGRFILHLLQRTPGGVPPVAAKSLKDVPVGSLDLDEPAFSPMNDARPS